MTDPSRIKILIVDDHPANLLSLEALLAGEGYELAFAESGGDALRSVAAEEFAVILLDVQMPVMDGYETARQIRLIEDPRRTPIIFLTANFPSELNALQGYEAGAVDYLTKPLNMDVLRAKIAVFADLLRAHRENRRQAEQIAAWERKETERAKRLSESRYQDLVEGIRDGIVWIADWDLRKFSFASRYAAGITGHPVASWTDESDFFSANLHPDDRARVLAAFETARVTRQPFSLEHRFLRTDGSTLWLRTSVQTDQVVDAPPEFRGLSVDVTRLKSVEEALRKAVRARDEFLSIASHELRTPITPLQLQMQGFARFIDLGRTDQLSLGKLREMVRLSASQVSRLGRLVGQLLEVSRIDIDRFEMTVTRVNLREIVSEVVRQFQTEIQATGSVIQLRMEEVEADVDPARIEQVVINLLSNALKFSAGRTIDVGLSKRGGMAVFSVKDNGMGIAKADQSRIFERFERAVSERHYGGLGLGLYISAQIVRLHHGNIFVVSEPGQGACFYVEVPLAATDRPVPVEDAEGNLKKCSEVWACH